MSMTCRLLAAALLAVLGPASAWAQSSLTEDNSAYTAGVETPVATTLGEGAAPGPACDATCDGGSDECCDDCCGHFGDRWPCGCSLECLGESRKFFNSCWMEERGIVAGGWLAQSYTWNPYQPNDRFNGPVTWTDRANDYQMNELYFFLGKAADNDGCCWDFGYRMDAMYGSNYRWNTSGGFETNFGNGSTYGLAVPALYAEMGRNGWNIKIGRMMSPVGYYVIGTANNFFPVLPYTFQYGEPFTHTGVHVNKKINDNLTVGGAVHHGWDNSDNTGNPHAGVLGNVMWTIDDQRSLTWVGIAGPEANFSGTNLASNGFGYTNRYLQTLTYIRKFNDDVTGVLQSDFGTQHDAVVAGQTAKWYGINSYLYWNQTCRCQWGLGAEWFRDQGGFRVGQVLPSFGSPNAVGFNRSGFDGSFYRLTFGPKYYFTPNIYARAAVLADWYTGPAGAGGLPFDDGTKNHQEMVTFDVVATF